MPCCSYRLPFYIGSFTAVFYAMSLLLLLPFSAVATELTDDEQGHEQDFLFLLEEGYTQEKGEWQVGINYQHASYQLGINQKDSTDNAWEFGVEYGFTDRFQIEFSLAYQQSSWYQVDVKSDVSTLGNPEVELIYQVLQESNALPAISIGVGVAIPASSSKAPIRSDEWGYEGFASASKYLDDIGFVHANLAYGFSDQGDDTELSYGIAFVRPFNENLSWMIEFLVEKETEDYFSGSETQTLKQFSAGMSYQHNDGVIAGIAYGHSDNNQVLDHAITLKVQYEF